PRARCRTTAAKRQDADGHRAAAAAYARKLGFLRFRGSQRTRSFFRSRPQEMKRFYKEAKVTAAGDEFGVQLDGKPLLTPGKRALRVPSRALAEAIAAEWQGQGVTVKPLELPLTRLVSTALDRVEPRSADVIGEIAKYATT